MAGGRLLLLPTQAGTGRPPLTESQALGIIYLLLPASLGHSTDEKTVAWRSQRISKFTHDGSAGFQTQLSVSKAQALPLHHRAPDHCSPGSSKPSFVLHLKVADVRGAVAAESGAHRQEEERRS